MMTSGLIPRRAATSRPDRSAKVAIAVARRRLLGAHLTFVLELMERAREAITAPDALRIYARVHSLSDQDMQWLANEVLVYLGHGTEEDIAELHRRSSTLRSNAVEWDNDRTVVQQIRRRIKGRRNYRLRSFVDLHAGHVECEIARLHIENLVALCDVMDPLVPRAEIVRKYMQAVGVRRELWHILNWGLLDRVYEETGGDVAPLVTEPETTEREQRVPATSASPARAATRLSTV